MDLIRLVYNYTDSEIVWLIIKEDPDSWSSLLQPNLCKSVVQFQNTVKLPRIHPFGNVSATNKYGNSIS